MRQVFLTIGGDGKRALRLGLIFFALWIVLELLLAKLIANRFGWGATIMAHILKGGFGLLLLGWLSMRGMRKLRAALTGGQGNHVAGSLGFPIASAILIALPGLLPALAGIALFSPSLRRRVTARFFWGDRPPENPGEIDLDRSEWHEARKPRKPRRAIARKATLEEGPPSV